jgi:ubiquinone/menaquinone biosynthesis C-methylase UbiE
VSSLDPDLVWYYSRGREWDGLDRTGPLEGTRTKQIISRRLKGRSLSVVDIGGGPGYYACWLAAEGHRVQLVDPVPLHLEQAEARAREMEVTFAGTHLALADRLPFEAESFDVALLLGPLYHLADRDARIVALTEALRVLRPGGTLFAAGISRYAATVDGFFAGLVSQDAFVSRMQAAMANGQWRNDEREEGLFTTAYFHSPSELSSEMGEAGFSDPEVLAIEGIWSWIPGFAEKWQDEQFRSLLLETLEQLEADPSVVGLGGHLMGVARKG